MSSKAKRAQELFLAGYNCAQAVFGAFCEDYGIDFETGMRLTSSMGGGMGRLREVCGAVSSMFLIDGLAEGYSDPADRQGKTDHYARIQALAQAFKEANGSIICRDLLGAQAGADTHVPEKRTAEYYQKRSCPDLVYSAAEILEEHLSGLRDLK